MTKIQRLAALILGSIAIDIALSCAGQSLSPIAHADDPPSSSGSRLHAVFTVTTSDDGANAKQFAGWFDSTLGVRCAFATYADGTSRCMPSGADVAPTVSPLAFVDSACQLPIGEVSGSACIVPKFVGFAQTTGATCSSATTTTLWRAAEIAPPTAFYQMIGTSCTLSSSAWGPETGHVFAASAIIQPGELQSGTVTTVTE
jgi:hypothetical protein